MNSPVPNREGVKGPARRATRWVALDSRMILHTGVGTYLRTLFPHLPELGGDLRYLTLTNAGLPAVREWPVLNVRSRPLGLSSQLLPWELRRTAVELLYMPFFNVPTVWSSRLVATIYDLTPLVVRDTIGSPAKRAAFWAWVRLAARKADAIVTVSEHSRKDIVNMLHLAADKVTVVPPAVGPQFQLATDAHAVDELRRRLAADRFFLYVGRAKPHKNLRGLLRAFRRAIARQPAVLVIAGPPPPADLLQEATRLGVENEVRFVGYVSEPELPLYYQAATAVILPSLYEGFGLPALEGMACGTPVIASNRAAVPEVVDDAGLLVDPDDEEAIADAMVRVALDARLRRTLRDRGLERARLFSPKASAEQLAALFRRVLGEDRPAQIASRLHSPFVGQDSRKGSRLLGR